MLGNINQKLFLIIILIIFSGASAQDNLGLTVRIKKEEWPFLPVWCRYTQAASPYKEPENAVNPSPQAQILIQQIGKKGWEALHHYCYGLAKIYRSHTIGLTEQQRDFLLNDSIGEINYVLENSPADFILRPELLTKQGYVLLMLKKYREAEDKLRSAIRENPNYWPPYGYLADVYIEQNNMIKARSILENGLKIAPNAKGLKIRLANLNNHQNGDR